MILRKLLQGAYLIIALVVEPAEAQIPYSKIFTTHDGLIHPQITCLFKDSRSYLWVGTKGGVARFNGQTFTNYNGKDIGLAGEINQFHEDQKGNLWAINRQGISIYNGSSWIVYKFPILMMDQKQDAIRGDTFYYVDKSGGLNYFANGKFHQKAYFNISGKYARNIFFCALTQRFYAQFNDRSFDLGVFINDTLKYYKDYQPDEIGFYTTAKTFIRREFKNNTAYLYDLEDKPIVKIPVRLEGGEVILVSDTKGNMVLWNSVNGVINDNTFLASLINKPNQNSDVSAVLLDEYNIWIGTERGLIQIPKSAFSFFDRDSLPFPWGIIQNDKDNIIVADFISGLFEIDTKNTIRNISRLPRWYFHPAKSPDGTIYLNNETQIYRYLNGKLEQVIGLKHQENGITSSLYLFWSKQLDKLICGQYGGLAIYHPDPKNIETVKWTSGDFPQFHVKCIAEDCKGNLWCGSNAGLVCLDPQSGNHTYYPKETGSYLFQGIISIETFADSILFLGATNGLWKFNLMTKNCNQVLSRSLNHPVSSILNYNDSLLICGHNQGVTSIKIQTLISGVEDFREFNYFSGFPGLIPDQNTAYIDKSGNYYVGAFDRLCMIPVNSLWHNEQPVRLQVLKMNNQLLSYHNEKHISPFGKGISVEFELIGQLRSIEPKFRYRIIGHTEWSEWFSYQHIILPELFSGSYQLELETDWNFKRSNVHDEPTIFKFEVRQNLWDEPDFNYWISGVGLFFLIALGIYFYRYQNSRRMLAQLEQETKYHQARMLTAQLNPHFMSNFLTSIQKSVKFNDADEATGKLLQVAEFLRKFLGSLNSKEKNGLIKLHDELEIVRIFLKMQNILHNDRLHWEIKMDDNFDPTEWLVPPLMIQPFVENSIVWGIDLKETDGKSGNITITIEEKQHVLLVIITDDGIGVQKSNLTPGKPKRVSSESGAKIVQERIQLLKSLNYKMDIEISSLETGTTVIIKYPKSKA